MTGQVFLVANTRRWSKPVYAKSFGWQTPVGKDECTFGRNLKPKAPAASRCYTVQVRNRRINRGQRIVDEQATTGKLRLVLAKTEFGIVEHVRATQDADHLIKHCQAFFFEIDAHQPEYAVAFQVVGNQWHQIPLVDAKHYEIEITAGTNVLPRTASGEPDPIQESHDLGLH
ncbi:hypothetical protein [uncultured Tateyamaria sp.]|uniref:hypothetical protein n=1 Tax=uncultured Tateyamaria sp. TaxID=455651 RepID=UPI0026197B3C|nr:hypothetical protein [uncultured Tateyamaria sp.]